MTNSIKEELFIPVLVTLIIFVALTFSKSVDKQIDKYAEKISEKKKQEEKITWRTGKFGPPIYLKETQQGGLKTKP